MQSSNNWSYRNYKSLTPEDAIELNITPTTNTQTKTGLFSKVTVNGDADLVAENIKKDVEIFGVTGNYEDDGENNTPEYEQLVNYTMLYDGSLGDAELNECKEVTGGWNLTFKTGNSTITKNATNLIVKSTGNESSSMPSYGKACTLETIDLTNYNNIFIKSTRNMVGTSSNAFFGFTTTPTVNPVGTGGQLETINSDFQVMEFSNNYTCNTFLKTQSNLSSGESELTVYALGMTLHDDLESLASKAGITATTIDEILTNSENLLSNEDAVIFMIYNCTGDFMINAVQSETFLTALNNSTYKTKVYANEHWSKFLTMVM